MLLKTPIFVAVLVLFLSTEKTSAISFDPPSKVETAFREQFPSINEVKWAKSDNTFVAEFKDNNYPVRVSYDTLGNFMESEKEIAIEDLPAKVLLYINTQDETAKILKAYRIEKKGQRAELYDVVAKIHYKKSRITVSKDGYLTSR
jgi:hypothetical protein